MMKLRMCFLYTRFFFKDGRLIACWEKMDAYNVYAGGVLDQLA